MISAIPTSTTIHDLHLHLHIHIHLHQAPSRPRALNQPHRGLLHAYYGLLVMTKAHESCKKSSLVMFGFLMHYEACYLTVVKNQLAGWCKCSQHTSMRHRIRNLIRRNTYGFAYNSFCSKQSCSNVCVKLRETFGNVLSVLVQQSISTLKW